MSKPQKNRRQWAARVRLAICWYCNKPLTQLLNLCIRRCDNCHQDYPEIVRLQWLQRIRDGRTFGYSLGRWP